MPPVRTAAAKSDQALPVSKNLLPLKDADLLAQTGGPEWVAVHKIIDGAMALSLDQPQPAGTGAVGSLTERSGGANFDAGAPQGR